jgi:hypothetical protein
LELEVTAEKAEVQSLRADLAAARTAASEAQARADDSIKALGALRHAMSQIYAEMAAGFSRQGISQSPSQMQMLAQKEAAKEKEPAKD